MAGNGRKVSCIVAVAKNGGIGKNGQLPWRLRSELKHFARITSTVKDEGKQNAVIMGRKTWESIPKKHRPLRGRLNIILSKTMSNPPEGVLICSGIQQALDILSKPPYDQSIEDVFVTGGYSSYKETVTSPNVHRIYLTRVHLDVECDVFFPEFDKKKFNIISLPNVPTEVQEDNGVQFQYFVYERNTDL